VIFPLLPKDESSDPAAKALVAAPRAGAVSPPSGSNPPPHPAEMARTQTIDDGPMTLRENIVRMGRDFSIVVPADPHATMHFAATIFWIVHRRRVQPFSPHWYADKPSRALRLSTSVPADRMDCR